MKRIYNYLKKTGWILCVDNTGIFAESDGVQIKIYKLDNPRGFNVYVKTTKRTYNRICCNSDEVLDIAEKSIRVC